MIERFRSAKTPFLFLFPIAMVGCQAAYYNMMESVGVQKREIMVDRVKDAQKEQEEAKEQFQTTLEQFAAVVDYEGGDLEKIYNRLNRELERSESAAARVTDRIASVEAVSEALFEEWERELEQFENESFRRDSEQKLAVTEARYHLLIGAMKRAESKMEPVLVTFRDNVLYLKHNLNARAIAALENELASIESDVGDLIREMETAIEESASFIASMETA